MAGCEALARLIKPILGETARASALSLIEELGSLPAVMRAGRSTLARSLPEDACELVRAARALMLEALRIDLQSGPILSTSQAVMDYLFMHIAHEPVEQVRVLYLDAKNRLIRDDVAIRGTVDRADIVPREIVRRALDLGAIGMILAHNHPSGDPAPSEADLAATRTMIEAAHVFDIRLLDHIIIGRSGCVSLRAEGLLRGG